MLKHIRILVADHHAPMRRALRILLESQEGFSVVGEASNGREAIAQVERLKPDVAILDISLPGLDGPTAAQTINTVIPNVAVIITSIHADEGYVVRALSAGVRGYVLKDSAQNDITEAIHTVRNGKLFFSPEILKTLEEDYKFDSRGKAPNDGLTSAEQAVLKCLAEGNAEQQTALMLGMCPGTVERHLRSAQSKLNLRSPADLILYVVRRRLFSEP